jgi:hypothetical protein
MRARCSLRLSSHESARWRQQRPRLHLSSTCKSSAVLLELAKSLAHSIIGSRLSRKYRTRTLGSGAGMGLNGFRLSQHTVAEVAEAAGGHHSHFNSKQVPKIQTESDGIEQGSTLLELDQEIDVTRLLTLAARRVSSTLRHPAWEFTDFLPLSSGRVEPAC